jgi:Protein of unknown function (DUF1573)
MKKLFVAAASLVLITSSFAQTKTEVKKNEKKVETKVVQPKAKSVKNAVTKAIANSEVQELKNAKKSKEGVMPTATKQVEAAVMPVEGVDQPVKAMPVDAGQVVTPPPPPALIDVNKDFEFKNDAYNFGKIPAGKPAKYEVFIKNISKETQELTLVQPGCGCTTPEYTQNQKFVPGETVKVVLGYNGGAPGNGSPFSKSVTVTLKGHTPKPMTFSGETYAVPTESAPANNAAEKLKPAQ